MMNLSDEGYAAMKKGVASSVLTNLCMLIPFGVVLQWINVLLRPLDGNAALDTNSMWIWYAAGLVGVVLSLLSYRVEYDKTYTAAYTETGKTRVEVAERLRKLPLSFFNSRDTSELTTNIMGDCASIEHAMSHVVPGLFAGVITVTLACVLLAILDWRMAAALYAALPVSLGLIFLMRRVMNKAGERHVKAKLDVAEQTQEYLEGIKVVKAYGLSGAKSKALRDAMRRMMREAVVVEAIGGSFVTLAMMILQVGIGFVTLAGVTFLTGGTLSPTLMLAFLVISAKIYAPVIVVLTLMPEFFYMMISTRRMQALRRERPMTGDADARIDNYNIELKNVSFAYNREDVIRSVSLKIPQGGVTALVGPSGSGKTTLSRLIARFWDVREGTITVGGRDIRGVDPERLMSLMSFVFQDVVLFNDTVMNNIRVGKQGATDEEVYAAAKAARCDEFVSDMPQRYETVIGENGCTLSGGERQRISIARALLKNAPIVLLDEATASLDPENETLIQDALSALVKGRTVLVIAHRLRTVEGADKIVVLDKGRLAEEGSSETLLAKGGLFARMYQIQKESLGWSVAG
jgi:ATP-binding cassette subfamily B protein